MTELSIKQFIVDFEAVFGECSYEAQAHTGGKVYAKGKITKYNPDHLVIPTPGYSGLYSPDGYLLSGGMGKTGRKGKK